MKDILINVNPSDTQVCIVENGELVEFWVERKNLTRLVGNIYKGKVQNVLNGMQAAFVNIGLEKTRFFTRATLWNTERFSKTLRIKNSI